MVEPRIQDCLGLPLTWGENFGIEIYSLRNMAVLSGALSGG